MSACPPLLAKWSVSQVSRKENLEELTSRPPTRIRAPPKPLLIVECAAMHPTTTVCIQKEYVGRLRPAVCRRASGRVLVEDTARVVQQRTMTYAVPEIGRAHV